MISINKPSMYNYFTENRQGELLIYNTFTGSLGKINVGNADTVRYWLSEKPEIVDESLTDLYIKMVKLGFLVPEEQDEAIKMSLINRDSNSMDLIILPTEQCNYRCVYCYESFQRGKMSLETQNALIKYVRKNIHYFNKLRVSWFGGEPLIAMDVIKNLSQVFMDICKKQRRFYFSDMTTNGYLLSLPVFKTLLNFNVLNYQITIDGTRETHNRQKPLAGGGETFDRVINNLLSIKQEIKTGRFSIIIRTNITKEIFDNIKEYLDFVNNVFGDDERFRFFFRPAGDLGGELTDNIRENFIDTRGISDMMEFLINSEEMLNTNYQSFLSIGGSACYAGKKNSIVIDSEGNLRKCTCHLEDMDNNKIGTLIPSGDFDIDKYKHAQWLTGCIDNPQCSNCFFLPACQRYACPAKVVYGTAGSCPYEKEYLDVTLRLLDKNTPFALVG